MINSQAIQEVKNVTMVKTQAIAKMENQIGQIANHLGEREKRKFPSQTELNPKAFAIGNSSNFYTWARACASDCHTKVRETSVQSCGGPRS
jgi:hypothetical protein